MKESKEAVEWLLKESGVTTYKISKETGIGLSALYRYTQGKAEVGNMTLDNAIKLHDFAKTVDPSK